MAAPRTLPKTDRAARTRRRILDAAGECFVAQGYAKTTVEEIAAASGVSKGLFYHYFRGKEEVLVELVEATVAEWDAVTSVAGDAAYGKRGDALAALSAMHLAALDYARANPVLQSLLQMESWLLIHARVGPAMRASMERFRAEVRALVERGVKRGELRDDIDPASLTETILVFHLSYVQAELDSEWVDVSAPGRVESGLEVLFRGIARQP